MKKKLTLLIIVIVLASLFKINVQADSAPVQIYSGNVVSYDSKGISLAKEDLNLDIHDLDGCTVKTSGVEYCEGYYNVEAIFNFDNPSEPLDLDTFFPFPSLDYGVNPVEQIEMIFNDERITSIEQKNFKFETKGLVSSHTDYSAFARLNFKNGSNKLVVKYKQKLNPIIKREARSGYKNLQYVLSSGSLWSGPIGELNITINFNYPISYQTYYFSNNSYYFEQTSNQEVKYKGINIEPQSEIDMNFIPSYVWLKLIPFINGEEYKLTYSERSKVNTILGSIFTEVRSGSDYPAINGSDFLFGIFTHNAIILVEDHQADLDTQEWYARYLMARLSLYYQNNELNQTCTQYVNSLNTFGIDKNITIFDIQSYTDSSISSKYVDLLNNYSDKCSKANLKSNQESFQNNNPNSSAANNSVSLYNSNNQIYLIFLVFSILLNIILVFRKQINKAISFIKRKLSRNEYKNTFK